MEIVEPVMPERTDVLWCLFEKLKDFYAQPLDGYWPLRPRWMPDISRARLHKSEFSPRNAPPIRIGFRRLTFEEFCRFYESLHFSEQRERRVIYDNGNAQHGSR